MKKSFTVRIFFLGIFLNAVFNSCSTSDYSKLEKSDAKFSLIENQICFAKSATIDWKNKKVTVSFEDAFEKFSNIEKESPEETHSRFSLSKNNLKQGITIQLKIQDLFNKSEKIAEIMIENYDLTSGLNEFTIGHKNNKPYIIY